VGASSSRAALHSAAAAGRCCDDADHGRPARVPRHRLISPGQVGVRRLAVTISVIAILFGVRPTIGEMLAAALLVTVLSGLVVLIVLATIPAGGAPALR